MGVSAAPAGRVAAPRAAAPARDLRAQAVGTRVIGPGRTPPVAPRHAGLARQTLRFCRTSDRVRLAYATSGAGPPPVKAANWMTHLDYDWASPADQATAVPGTYRRLTGRWAAYPARPRRLADPAHAPIPKKQIERMGIFPLSHLSTSA
jgi:hypothetical protein